MIDEEAANALAFIENEPLLVHDSRDCGVVVKDGFSMKLVDAVDEAVVQLHDSAAPFV